MKWGTFAAPQTVRLAPWQRPQEKGIDLAIALDLIEFVLTDCCDEINYCYQNQNCLDHLACLDDCDSFGGGSECYATCQDSNPTGANLYQTMYECAQTFCSTVCGL